MKVNWKDLSWQDIIKTAYGEAMKKKTKPGLISSEFLLLLGFNIFVQTACILAPQLSSVLKEIIQFGVPFLTTIFYTWMRTKYKTGLGATDEAKKLAENTKALEESIKKLDPSPPSPPPA